MPEFNVTVHIDEDDIIDSVSENTIISLAYEIMGIDDNTIGNAIPEICSILRKKDRIDLAVRLEELADNLS